MLRVHQNLSFLLFSCIDTDQDSASFLSNAA